MPGAWAALKGATAVGYAVGIFAVALAGGVAAIAHNTGNASSNAAETREAVKAHESADSGRERATMIRDSLQLKELEGIRHEMKKQTCVLVADTPAEKHDCERRNFVDGQ